MAGKRYWTKERMQWLAAEARNHSTPQSLASAASRKFKRPIARDAVDMAWRRYRPRGSPETIGELLDHPDHSEASRPPESKAPPSARELAQSKRSLHSARARLKEVTSELLLAERRAEVALAISDPVQPKPIRPTKRRKGLREAAAVALASDWHVEETVDPKTVNGLNEYNPSIAERRSRRFFEAIVWQIRHHSRAWSIPSLVLWLGGDLITGYIHEELEESNAMSPVESVLLVQGFIIAGIDHILAELPDLELSIPCSFGNHGRTTRKKRIKTAAKNSYEWLLYNQLASHYRDEKRVTFHIATGEHLYMTVYDLLIRFCHGDPIRGGTGIGGIDVPVNRAFAQWNNNQRADLTIIGHFHQYRILSSGVINGSLIGWNPFGIHIRAPFQHPQQSFFLIDSERGPVQHTPLWLTDAA